MTTPTSSLPEWIDDIATDAKRWKKDSIDEKTLLVIEALSIAWYGIVHLGKPEGCINPQMHSEETLRQIEELGK